MGDIPSTQVPGCPKSSGFRVHSDSIIRRFQIKPELGTGFVSGNTIRTATRTKYANIHGIHYSLSSKESNARNETSVQQSYVVCLRRYHAETFYLSADATRHEEPYEISAQHTPITTLTVSPARAGYHELGARLGHSWCCRAAGSAEGGELCHKHQFHRVDCRSARGWSSHLVG